MHPPDVGRKGGGGKQLNCPFSRKEPVPWCKAEHEICCLTEELNSSHSSSLLISCWADSRGGGGELYDRNDAIGRLFSCLQENERDAAEAEAELRVPNASEVPESPSVRDGISVVSGGVLPTTPLSSNVDEAGKDKSKLISLLAENSFLSENL